MGIKRISPMCAVRSNRTTPNPAHHRRAVSMLILCCTLLFSACGASSTQATSSTNSDDILFNGDGLHIEASLKCEENIVLATNRLTYDASEIQAMKTYLKGIVIEGSYNSFGDVDYVDYLENPVASPRSLAIIDGGKNCGAHIELTNTSANSIIIEQVGAKLLTAPTVNKNQYRLVDCYTVIPDGQFGRGCEVGGGLGGPQCDTYGAEIDLANGPAGTIFSDTPFSVAVPGFDCPDQFTIAPRSSAMFLDLDFTGRNMKYSVAIQLKIRAADGEKTVVLSKSPTTLTFAGDAQLSCYGLQGTNFTLLAPAAEPDDYQCV